MIGWLREMGVNEASMIAGGIGAAVAAFRMPGPWIQRIPKFTIGFAIALWTPGIIIKWMSLPEEPQFYGALGFVCGYFGMTITDALQDALEGVAKALREIDWKEIALGWLKRK